MSGNPNSTDGAFRHFEFVDEKSSKFWEVRVTGQGVEVRYGKIGTAGQTLLKPFDDAAAAHKAAEKLVAEKLKGGYVESAGASAVAKPAASAAVPSAAVAKAAPKVAPKSATKAAAKTAPEPAATVPAPSAKKATPAADAKATRTLCISGKLPSGLRKADYESALLGVGIELIDDVVKGLNFLVLADPTATSSKAEKARKLGVRVISEDQLIGLTSGAWSGV